MISLQQIAAIVSNYDLKNVTVGTIGSHSALEIMDGAKDENLKTICICQKGRELPYRRFKRLVDEIILLDKFSDIFNVMYFNEVDRGGHFAAWEEPQLFSQEVRAAFRPLRSS